MPPDLAHPVCHRSNKTCQSGQPSPTQADSTGAYCGVTDNCVVPPGLSHAVCRHNMCQSGQAGAGCGVISDCVAPPDDALHAVCRDGTCQWDELGKTCGVAADCVPTPEDLHFYYTCKNSKCKKCCYALGCFCTPV